MTPEQQNPQTPVRLPGFRLKHLARRSRMLRALLGPTHILQIIDDHQAMWLEAVDDAQRAAVVVRLRKQLALAGVHFFGFELAIHGAVNLAFGELIHGGSLFLIGAAIVYSLSRGN